MWYEEKEFKDLTLDDCRFEECTFQNCHFTGTSLRDARLSGCMFRECTFDGVVRNGARFDGMADLEQVHMKEIHTNSFSEDRRTIAEMQGMTEWIGCFLSGVTIAHSDFSASCLRRLQTGKGPYRRQPDAGKLLCGSGRSGKGKRRAFMRYFELITDPEGIQSDPITKN